MCLHLIPSDERWMLFYKKKSFINQTGRSQEQVQKGLQECLNLNRCGISWPLFTNSSNSTKQRRPWTSRRRISKWNSPLISCTAKARSIYKVVQIWPGQSETCLHTNSPGHIWTTLYIPYDNPACSIIQHLSRPKRVRLTELSCTFWFVYLYFYYTLHAVLYTHGHYN
jgi:hypothetical protein